MLWVVLSCKVYKLGLISMIGSTVGFGLLVVVVRSTFRVSFSEWVVLVDMTNVLMFLWVVCMVVAVVVVVLPMLFLLVKRMIFMRYFVLVQILTCFFSFFSVVSMMIFSVLCLSMLSIGILTSTDSW